METIVLDNNTEYAILKEEIINDTLYTLFSNINDKSDICFRKTVTKDDGNRYYVVLDDEKEFNLVVNHFAMMLLKDL